MKQLSLHETGRKRLRPGRGFYRYGAGASSRQFPPISDEVASVLEGTIALVCGAGVESFYPPVIHNANFEDVVDYCVMAMNEDNQHFWQSNRDGRIYTLQK